MAKLHFACLLYILLYLGFSLATSASESNTTSFSMTISASTDPIPSSTPSGITDSTSFSNSTTDSATTSGATTTDSATTSVATTTDSATTSDAKTTDSATTSVATTTDSATTSGATTTDSATTSDATTTDSATTSDAKTTDSATTSGATTTDSATTSGATTTDSVTTSDATTSEIITTSLPPTTTPTPHDLSSPFIWTGGDINPSFPYVIVRADEDYSSIVVNVSDVYIPYGKYMYICGGEELKSDATDGRVFLNTVKGPRSYLFKTSSVYAYTNAKSDECNFTVTFESAEKRTTTVPTSSTTEISWPTTEKEASIYITVNVSGKNLEEYNIKKTLDAFKSCVAQMATTYCKSSNIHTIGEITETNVVIRYIERCPYTWPDSDKCVQINFKLPIYYDSGEDGYQLNSHHLKIMWLQYMDDSCMSNNGFSNYEEPDFNTNITWWAIGISVVIALFIILLWFLKKYGSKFGSRIRRRHRRYSDTTSIISSKKDSTISLAPHYLQDYNLDTPKYFEN